MFCSVVFQCLREKTACAVYMALGLVKGSACPNCKNGYCLSPEAQYVALVEEQKKLGKVDMALVSAGYHSFNDLYEHQYALFGALYIFSFSENSDIQISLIDSSTINVAAFPAAKVTASRVHVKEVTPYSGDEIRFVLAEAAHVVHKNGTGDFVVSTDALAIIPQ